MIVATLLPLLFFVAAWLVSRYMSPRLRPLSLLVPTFLKSGLSPSAFCARFAALRRGTEYAGFNLLVGDFDVGGGGVREIRFLSNRPASNVGGLGLADHGGANTFVREIDIGGVGSGSGSGGSVSSSGAATLSRSPSSAALHGLSNASLDSPWGTLERGLRRFGRVASLMGCRAQLHLRGLKGRPEEQLGTGEGASRIVEEVMMDSVKCR